MAILLKLKDYLYALGAFIAAVLGAFLWGKLKGDSEGARDEISADQDATAKAIEAQTLTKQEVQSHVDAMPTPTITVPNPLPITPPDGSQQIGNAQPDTAAGELQDNWSAKT